MCCRSTYAGGCECKSYWVVAWAWPRVRACVQVVAATGIWRGAQGDDRQVLARVAPADNGRCRQASQRVLSRVEGELRYHGVVLWPLGELYVSDGAGVEEHHLGNAIAGLALSGARVTSEGRLNRRTVISRVVVGGGGVAGGGCCLSADDEQRQQREDGGDSGESGMRDAGCEMPRVELSYRVPCRARDQSTLEKKGKGLK